MKIILFLLKCLVGIFATIGFLFVALLVTLVVVATRIDTWEPTPRKAEVPAETILALDLSKGLVEVKPDNPLARASLGRVTSIREAVDGLRAAGRDPRVKGLVARLGRGGLGMAQAQELREAVAGFRGQGKFTIAFAEGFGEGGGGTRHYYLASAFEEVWLLPSGTLGLTGVLIESPFLREALDKIGVQPQLLQREEFKGVMNTFTDSGLPDPQRENLQRLVDSWLEQMAAGISASRGIDKRELRLRIDKGPYLAAEALEFGLVDRLGYWDELIEALHERAGEDADFLDLAAYEARRNKAEPDGPVIGLIYGLGPVQMTDDQGDSAFGNLVMGADTVSKAIRDAVADEEVEAIVFRVSSPGGSYVASDVIWREVREAREAGKPVIVSMGDIAASGGYFVAAPAERILAQPGTVTGSIGVVSGKMALGGLWDKLGVAWDGVQAGENAEMWSPHQPFDEAGWSRLETMIDAVYEDFTGKVAEGRGMERDAVLAAAKGQVWTGEDALARGLVDELGGFARAVAVATEAAGGAPGARPELRRFPAARDPLRAVIEDTFGAGVDGGVVGLIYRLALLVRTLEPLAEAAASLGPEPRGIQLRAPDLVPAQ